MPKIYTKVGDQGFTVLIGGEKVPKNHSRIKAYGTVDELNSSIGSARSELLRVIKALADEGAYDQDLLTGLSKMEQDLEKIQHWCFDLGSLLAAPLEKVKQFNLPQIELSKVQFLEAKIDDATAIIPKLTQFILPAGSEIAVRLHHSRTTARRAERYMVMLGAELPENSIPFINRLSDYLFTMARYANYKLGIEETFWKKQDV